MGNVLKHTLTTSKEKKSTEKSKPTTASATAAPVEEDLETFLIVWVDPRVNINQNNLETQQALRKISTSVITFEEFAPLERLLENCSPNQKIILIVSGTLGREIVPKIHHLPVIIAIHVYCLDVDGNKIWAQGFSKIRSVVKTRDQLLAKLSDTQVLLENREDSMALRILPSTARPSALDNASASFVWFQLFLEILISPDYLPVSGSFDELIQILRRYSAEDKNGLQLISTFEKTYRSDQAIAWLTSETPLARFLYKALRERDVNILFAFRFLLRDIHAELRSKQIRSLTVFKFQAMSRAQMESLRATPGGLLVVDNFLFASTERVQMPASMETNEALEIVLWEIDAEEAPMRLPFAQLDSLTGDDSGPVLFMCGSTFEVGPLVCDNLSWKLHLKLVSPEHSPALKRVRETLRSNRNPYIIVDLLEQCDERTKAAVLSQKLLALSPPPPANVASPLMIGLQCLLVCLSKHQTKFSSMVLNALRSLTPNSIFVIEDATIDFSRYSTKSLLVFTTTKWISESKALPNEVDVYTLDDKAEQSDGLRQFGSIDLMISHLADRIIEELSSNTGDASRKNKVNERIERFYQELAGIAESATGKTRSNGTIRIATPILVWLTSRGVEDDQDRDTVIKTFKKRFLSFEVLEDPIPCHEQIVKHQGENYVFLVMNQDDYGTSLTQFQHLPHVKRIYCYGVDRAETELTICGTNKLIYRLTCDLIDHYEKLGQQYQANKQTNLARDMFLQAKDLCLFLSETCFPKGKSSF